MDRISFRQALLHTLYFLPVEIDIHPEVGILLPMIMIVIVIRVLVVSVLVGSVLVIVILLFFVFLRKFREGCGEINDRELGIGLGYLRYKGLDTTSIDQEDI